MLYPDPVKRHCHLFAAFFILLASCSQEKPAPRVETPTFVGVVDNVYSKQGYVLVRLNGMPPAEGAILISQSPEKAEQPRIANLVVSAERLGNLRIPADIRSGTVEKGDLVFLYKNLAAPDKQPENPFADEITPTDQPAQPPSPAAAPVAETGNGLIDEIPTTLPPNATPKPAPANQSDQDRLKDIPTTYDEAVR